MFRKLLISMLGVVAIGSASAQQADVNFGIISTDSAAHLKEEWAPILKDMEKKTGYKVNAYFASDYAGIIEAMRFKKVDVAWMGNKSGIEAVDRAGGEVFAQTSYADGSPGYWSLLITHIDSPYKTVEDVIKHGGEINFGLGDPNSTSGTAVPGYYVFAKNNIDPKTYFKSARPSNHEANLMAVANKQVDVATNNTEAFEKFQRRTPEMAKNIRVIWKSPLIPADPMVWRTDLDSARKAKIKAFFLAYGQGDSAEAKEELAKLAKLTFGVFRDSSNDQLVPIRQLELAKAKLKIESDSTISADEKKAKIAEIDKKLAALNTQVAAK